MASAMISCSVSVSKDLIGCEESAYRGSLPSLLLPLIGRNPPGENQLAHCRIRAQQSVSEKGCQEQGLAELHKALDLDALSPIIHNTIPEWYYLGPGMPRRLRLPQLSPQGPFLM